jgi:flavin-dependent dehydrogenase
MRIAVVGGGPGGLYLAALTKQLDPTREVVVRECNAAADDVALLAFPPAPRGAPRPRCISTGT